MGILIAIAIFLQFTLLSEFIYRNILIKLTGRTGDVTLLILAVFILFLALLLIHSSQTLFILFTGVLSLILLMMRSSKKIGNEQAE